MTEAQASKKIIFNEETDEILQNIDEKTPSDPHYKWESLNLKPEVMKGIYSVGFYNPSFIQKTAIPIITQGKDLRAQAQSGTGKTGAFVIGTLQCVDASLREPQVLVLASTREIAHQNAMMFQKIGCYMNVGVCLLAGGGVRTTDIAALRDRPQIVVGTPGRVNMMLEEKHLNTSHIKIFVLDEADEMVKAGFEEQVKNVFVAIQAEHFQTLLFSATYSEQDLAIIKNMVQDPVEIDLRHEEQTLKGIKQYYVDIGPALTLSSYSSSREQEVVLKAHTVMDIFKNQTISQAMIFHNKKSCAILVHKTLNDNGFPCELITSDFLQNERTEILQKFKEGKTRILVSSGLCKRGIDVQTLSVVVCLDVPNLEEKNDFIHRVGRSGRYGRRGVALHILNSQEVGTLMTIAEHFQTVIEPFKEGVDFKD